MRCFLALAIPADVRERLRGLQGRLRDQAHGVKWVSPDQMHLTLKFFADLPGSDRPEVEAASARVCAPAPPVHLSVRGAGSFGPGGAIRVVWAGLEDGSGGLATLQKALEGALSDAGFPPEERPFSPHLTLGRVREPRRDPQLLQALSAEAGFDGGSFVARDLTLYASVLGPGGPTYTVLNSWPLGGADGN